MRGHASLKQVSCMLVFCALAATGAWAQYTTGQVGGLVRDPSGAESETSASTFIGDGAHGRVVAATQAWPPGWPAATQPSQSGQLNGVVRTGGSHPAFGGSPRAAS